VVCCGIRKYLSWRTFYGSGHASVKELQGKMRAVVAIGRVVRGCDAGGNDVAVSRLSIAHFGGVRWHWACTSAR
jgi:hypothetical protein